MGLRISPATDCKAVCSFRVSPAAVMVRRQLFKIVNLVFNIILETLSKTKQTHYTNSELKPILKLDAIFHEHLTFNSALVVCSLSPGRAAYYVLKFRFDFFHSMFFLKNRKFGGSSVNQTKQYQALVIGVKCFD